MFRQRVVTVLAMALILLPSHSRMPKAVRLAAIENARLRKSFVRQATTAF